MKPEHIKSIEGLLEKQGNTYWLLTHPLGIEYYERNVVNQLLEFMSYYTTEILMEAKVFKDYARLAANENENKRDNQAVSLNDVKLAIASKAY